MIDTIVFNIHDLQLHEPLCVYLNSRITKEGLTVSDIAPDDDKPEEMKRLYKTFLIYHDTGKMIERAHFNKLKSSHYEIAYRIDYVKDYISFNVSIPKYLFGTNVLLYNTSPTSRKFSYNEHSELRRNLEESFDLKDFFFDRFFSQEFGSIKIYRSFVEINRVDLCFNQVYHSKGDALEYLAQLKKIKKQYSRESSNHGNWKTTMMYKTDRYSFKCYHKGTEFRKNDRRKLEKQRLGLDLDHYQEFADRTLRYEMTLRGSYLSYLYMNHVFRKDCPLWKYSVDLFKKDKAKREGKKYMEWRKSLTADERKHLAYARHHIHKTKTFYLSDLDLDLDFDTDTDHYAFSRFPEYKEHFYYPAPFSRDLWRLMYKQFMKLLNEFKLETMQSNHTILSRLEQHNKEALNKKNIIKRFKLKDSEVTDRPREISRSKIAIILNLLQTHTFEEIANSGMISRTTWYRYRQDLERLGVTDKSLLSMTLNADFDLRRYNQHIMQNLDKFPFLRLVLS